MAPLAQWAVMAAQFALWAGGRGGMMGGWVRRPCAGCVHGVKAAAETIFTRPRGD